MKKITACKLLTGALVMSTIITAVQGNKVYAKEQAEYTKSENVYVKMDEKGKSASAYIVNNFNVTSEGEIIDYGEYDKVQNLTNLDEIDEDDGEQTFEAEKGMFYYQGNIDDADLPWSIRISYLLDDKEIEPEDLAGAEGDLEIKIHVEQNPVVGESAFFKAYLMQIQVPLDTDLCSDITIEGGSILDSGSNKLVSFTVMPGTSGDYNVKTAIEDFEMDNITFNASPQEDVSVSFADPQNTNDTKVMFMMTAEGISIPDVEEKVEKKEEKGIIEKLRDLISGTV